MAKIELEIAFLLVTTEVLAEAGDRLMVYNGAVIGVVPRNDALPTSLSSQGAAPKRHDQPVFDPAKVFGELRAHAPRGLSVRELNRVLGWTGTQAANACSSLVRRELACGNLAKTSGSGTRYPHVGLRC